VWGGCNEWQQRIGGVLDSGGYPWPTGSTTKIGSMPGTDPTQAMRVIAQERGQTKYAGKRQWADAASDPAG